MIIAVAKTHKRSLKFNCWGHTTIPLTFQLWIGINPIHGNTTFPIPMFLVNNRMGLVIATSSVSGHPISRSYETILPSSFEKRYLKTLGILYLPTWHVSFNFRVQVPTCQKLFKIFLGVWHWLQMFLVIMLHIQLVRYSPLHSLKRFGLWV